MSWARIDDAFDDHPKVLAVLEHDQGGAAIGLWTLCLTWAHRNTLRKNKTPGLLPASLPRRYLGPGARELAALLVKEGLWEALGDGDGWMIHDFDRYLPSEKTSAARSEAGKRGAASRWGKKPGDGKEPETDSKLPSGQDKEPEPGHDSAGKPVASDGSRAPARRAISNEIAPVPVPDPVPPSAALETSDATAQTLVAEWIDHCRKRPPKPVIGQVGKGLRELLDEGIDVADVRRGLAYWHQKGLHPSALASAVNEVMNAGRTLNGVAVDRKQQATDDMFDDALVRARAMDAQEGRR